MRFSKISRKIGFPCLVIALCFFLMFGIGEKSALAQTSTDRLFVQNTDRSQVRSITNQELAELGDPFFNLVLKDHADETNLAEIEQLLQPDSTKRETFVVSERILDASRPQSRRAILTFQGSNRNNGNPIFLSPNVMISVSFNSEDFSDNPEQLEIWGWDEQRGRYNYYRLDRNGNRLSEPRQGTLTWKFRGNSVNADNISPANRQGTCLQCHVNGGPIMKELFSPWNNWESSVSTQPYLRFAPPIGWPVVSNIRLKTLESAEFLESEIISAIKQFNSQRIDELTSEDSGVIEVSDTQRLLKPLFETTEFNLISSDTTTRLHPFTSTTEQPTDDYIIPNSFFLNADIIAGSRLGEQFTGGFRINSARAFEVKVKPEEYERLVNGAGVKLAGQQPGDANFAWLVPEPSFIDNNLVDQLITKNIVPREFVAAVLAIDLDNPVLSQERQRLFELDIIPSQFQVEPVNNLIPQTVAALESLNPASNSPEGQFLAILKSEDPVVLLRNKVDEYLEQETSLLNADDNTRFTELTRLYQIAVERRQAVLNDEVLGNLDETNGTLLLPVP